MVDRWRFRRDLLLNPPIVHFTSCMKSRHENPFLMHPNPLVSKRFIAKDHSPYFGALPGLHMEK